MLDGNGNVLVAGRFTGTADFNPGVATANLTANSLAGFVAKYSPTGAYMWAFGLAPGTGAGWHVDATGLAVDGSGNIALTGTFRGTADFNPGSGTATLASAKQKGAYTDDIFVARYNSSGGYLWGFRVGGTDSDWGCGASVDGSGNVYVTGRFYGTVDFNPGSGTSNLTSAGGMDLFVARYSAAGAYVWAARAGGNEGGEDIGYAVAVDGSGNVAVTGNRNSNLFIATYGSSGSLNWLFVPSHGTGRAVVFDGSGNICVTGSFTSAYINDFDPGSGTATLTGGGCFVAKYTSAGAYIWAFGLNSSSPVLQGFGIAVNGNGIYITGTFKGTADFDPSLATAILTTTGSTDTDIFLAQYSEATMPKMARGTDMSEALRMQIAPNPSTTIFTLRCDGISAPTHVEIIDMMGRVVETVRDVAAGDEISFGSDLPAGTYCVQVIQGEIRRQTLVHKVR